jgi:Ca2+-binding RTX toxin-like protein
LCGRLLGLAVGCAGTMSSETSNNKAQGSSPRATESEEEARCEGTRTIRVRPEPRSDVWNISKRVDFSTYDPRGCPKGGPLSGTDKPDNLAGRDVDDEIRGLGAEDYLIGGLGNDVTYGGSGGDRLADWPLAGAGGSGGHPLWREWRESS